jgi:hypothetical protein
MLYGLCISRSAFLALRSRLDWHCNNLVGLSLPHNWNGGGCGGEEEATPDDCVHPRTIIILFYIPRGWIWQQSV